MQNYQFEAILLATRNCGEADRMVTLFSKEYGKMTAIAYGARRPKSRLGGVLQPFAVVDVDLAVTRNLPSIKQCAAKHSFRELREDLTYMAYATFIAEMVFTLCPEHQPEPAVYELVLAAFALLQQRNPRIVTLACTWQLLAVAGFYPEYRCCLRCGQNIAFPACFDIGEGGCVCKQCSAGTKLSTISSQGGELLERLLTLDWHRPAHFTVQGSAIIEIEKLLAAYLLSRLEQPLKSWGFINLLHQNASDKSTLKREQ